MKYRLKTKIDITDRDDVVMMEGLAEFISLITDRKGAESARVTITKFIDSNFCPQCACDQDNCDCDPDKYERNRDYDYDYDNWVDRQMEEQGND